MHPAKRLLLLPAVAIALAAAGCGDDGKNDFIDGYNSATQPLNQLMGELGTASSATGAAGQKEARQKLTKLADGLEDVEGKLGDLEPPSDAKDEFDRMLKLLDENTDQVRTMAKAVGSGDVAELTKASAAFAEKGGQLVEAEQALRTVVNG
jgi:hypothetical protein